MAVSDKPYSKLSSSARSLSALAAYELAVSVVAEGAATHPSHVRAAVKQPGGLGRLRRHAVYLACMTFNQSRRAIAAASGLSPEAVAKACRHIEILREDGAYDRQMDDLELSLMGELETGGLPA